MFLNTSSELQDFSSTRVGVHYFFKSHVRISLLKKSFICFSRFRTEEEDNYFYTAEVNVKNRSTGAEIPILSFTFGAKLHDKIIFYISNFNIPVYDLL